MCPCTVKFRIGDNDIESYNFEFVLWSPRPVRVEGELVAFDALTPLNNAEGIVGRIALVERNVENTLEATALAAEKAGAIAVVITMNDEETMPYELRYAGMLGKFGAPLVVGIPVWILSRQHGQKAQNRGPGTKLLCSFSPTDRRRIDDDARYGRQDFFELFFELEEVEYLEQVDVDQV